MPRHSKASPLHCGVYAIRHLPSGRHYIGSSMDMQRRWKRHRSALRKNKHHSPSLQAAWNQDGEGQFEFIVLEECESNLLPEREVAWVQSLHAQDPAKGLNATQMGRGLRHGRPPKATPPWRPQLRLEDRVLARLKAYSLDDVAAMLTWALDHWPGRAGLAARSDLRQERTLRPSRPQQLEPVRIWHDADVSRLCVHYGFKSDALREWLWQQHCRWHERRARFERPTGERPVRPEDLVCELAAGVYQQGYSVTVPNEELARRVLMGRYTRENRRWVGMTEDGDFLLSWEYGGDDVYRATKHLKGAHWDKALQGTVMRRRAIDDLIDFTRSWGFQFSEAAAQAVLDAQAEMERDLIGVTLILPPDPHTATPAPAQTTEGVIPHDLLADPH